MHVFLEKSARAKVGNNDFVLQISEICALIVLLIMEVITEARSYFAAPHTYPLLRAPPSLPEAISREFKQLVPFFHTSSFSPF